MTVSNRSYKLTHDQLMDLAIQLEGSNYNPYHMANRKFGVWCNEALLDDLRIECSIFRCKECGLWCGLEDESIKQYEVCDFCV